MEKKLTKEERIKEKEKLSEVITGKMMTAFFALVVAIMALIYFGERVIPSVAALTAVQIAMGVLTVAALVWYSVSLKNKADNRFKILSPAFVLGMAASALFATLMYPTIGASHTILSVIALAVLFFVYEIYPVDFFLCSVAVAAGGIASTVINSQGVTLFKDLVMLTVYALVMAVCVIVFAKLVKEGKFRLGKKVVKKPRGMLPAAVIVSFAVSLIAVVGVLILGGYLSYLIAAACVTYFVIAIIYTVKLI